MTPFEALFNLCNKAEDISRDSSGDLFSLFMKSPQYKMAKVVINGQPVIGKQVQVAGSNINGHVAETTDLDEFLCVFGTEKKIVHRSQFVEIGQKALQEAIPIPMILICPDCLQRHIDSHGWEMKPHTTHACQHCGFIWRPALVATVGVQFLPGFKNDELFRTV